MNKIKEYFDRCYGSFGAELPQAEIDVPDPDYVTQIFVRGWLIWYRFGVKNGKWYLDLYATHRMTDGNHARIWEDGTVVRLPTPGESYVCVHGRDPMENRRKDESFYRRNRKLFAILDRKGFTLRELEAGSNRERWRAPLIEAEGNRQSVTATPL